MYIIRKTAVAAMLAILLVLAVIGLAPSVYAADHQLIIGEYAAGRSQVSMRWRGVDLTPALLHADGIASGDTLMLELFPDAVYTARVDKVISNINGTVTVRGRIKHYPMAYALISTTGDRSLAEIEIPEKNQRFIVESDSSGDHYLMDVSGTDLGELEDGPSLIPSAQFPLLYAPNESIAANGPLDPATVDVMIVYTPAARDWAGGATGIANVIAQAMAKGQLACDNSNTALTLRLVHSAEVSYTESSSSSTDLNRLTSKTDGYMDNVHTWRNQYGADLVTMLAYVSDTGGIGWLLNTTAGLPDYAFNLCRVQQSSWTYTVVHEQGHNMGCHHHKEQTTQPGPGLFDYSAGWRWVGTNGGRYCSVMTYESGSYFEDGLTHTQVGYWSNPSVTYQGVATGQASDGDNARGIREIKHVVAAYRTPDITPPTISISAPSSSLTSTGPVTYTVTYGGADSVTLAAGNITLNKTGSADGTVEVSGTGNTTRTVTISNVTGNGTLGISIAAGTASDSAGNTAPGAGPSATFDVDNRSYLTSSSPADQKSLWRSAKNIVRLTFDGDIIAPSAGQVTVCEMLTGGTYGPDLSSGFTFTVENDGAGHPRILNIRENATTLTHRKWYAVRNTGSWVATGSFTVQYVLQVGDSSNDGRVLNQDVSIIRTGIPTSAAADDDRRDINGDGRILNGDASIANSKIPSNTVAKPSGH